MTLKELVVITSNSGSAEIHNKAPVNAIDSDSKKLSIPTGAFTQRVTSPAVVYEASSAGCELDH